MNIHWRWCFVAAAVAVYGCAQPGAGTPDVQSSSEAAHQADMANRRACIAEMRQMNAAGVDADAIAAKRQACVDASIRITEPYRQSQLAAVPGIYGQTLRQMDAARTAEQAGNYEEALRNYRAIDANAPAIEAEVSRMASVGSTVSQANSPAANMQIMNYQALQHGVAIAQRKIGESYEAAKNYPEAAAYYQKALDTMGYPRGVELIAIERLAFLYANGLGVPKDDAKARQMFGLDNRYPTEVDLMDKGRLPKSPEEVPAVVGRIEEEQREADEEMARERVKAAAENARAAAKYAAEHPVQARIQQCISECRRQYGLCEQGNSLGDIASIFGAYSPREHCGSEGDQCLSRCQ